jgi:hypothetical protein
MRTSYFCIFVLSIVTRFISCTEPIYAVTLVPVADLIGQPAHDQTYFSLPLFTKPVTACPRIHQLLYNEIVTIEEEQGAQVRVSFNSVFYEQRPHGAPQTSFWSLKKNFITFDQLLSKKISLSTIPHPINFRTKKIGSSGQDTVSLLFPHYDSSTHTLFSVGTRFVIAQHENSSKSYSVFVIDPHTISTKLIHLPANKCMRVNYEESMHEKRNRFVNVLRTWAHPEHGFIPYVWGGCSFTHLHNDNHFVEHKENGGVIKFNPIHRHNKPCTGFDCAGMIVRAAQLCTIPFFYKNTATMANHLPEIKEDMKIEEGDIIWFNGHVMIVSDLKKNKIIEARAYSQGYGKIHELPLSAVFKEIGTFEQLRTVAQQKKKISRLQKDGTVAHAISQLKLFKLTEDLH